jgi:acylphosphatase
MAYKRAHLMIEGRVQGVFFRQSMKKAADLYGVSGWVRNLVSGEVEATVEGDEAAVNGLIEWCRAGPDRAHVEHVAVEWQEPTGKEGLFAVKG